MILNFTPYDRLRNISAFNQSGFRRLQSTVTCLLRITDDWYTGLDSGQMLGMVFVDLKKAFDTVDHRALCNKLELYGVQQRELSWVESYLTNRKQYCCVGGYDSNMGEVEVGVPQGSCLGPLLFLIYINDLPKIAQGKVSMYADDTSLCHIGNDISKLETAINEDLKLLDKWLKGNKLSLDVAKTKSMLICTKPKRRILENNDVKLTLMIRDRELDLVDEIKYLGVNVDDSLSWKEHIKSVTSKVSRGIGNAKTCEILSPRSLFKNPLLEYCEPYFRYCCSVWGACGLIEKNRLQKFQNRAAKIVSNSKFDAPSRPLIERLGWKTIDKLIAEESNTKVYKSLNDLAPQYLGCLFTRNSAGEARTLRNTSTDLRIPKKTSLIGQRGFSYRGVKLWNSPSAEAKLASSLGIFKKLLHSY